MNRGRVAVALLAASVLPPSAQALELAGRNLYVDGVGYWGYSRPTVVSGIEKPTVLHWGAGFTGALWLLEDRLFAGITSDFRYAGQYSTVNSQVGNIRGTRWNWASPTFGTKLGDIVLKADIQFLGPYFLLNAGGAGDEVSYKKPLGFRVVGLYPVREAIHVGAHFERVSFGSQSSSAFGDRDLSSKFNLWQAGVTAGYLF